MAAVHVLEREQSVSQPLDAVFRLFSDAFALERITPAWLRFQVVTDPPIEIGEGTLISYSLRLHRIPIRWLTRIEVWEPPFRFVDLQLRGPYTLWEHTHSFAERSGETVIRDRVRYALPLGPLGELARIALVRRDLERIFDYRLTAIARILRTPPTHREAALPT
jgi:ligand-binding SRPBCC domain-containing protein